MDDDKINDNTVVQFEGKQKEVDQDKIDLVMGGQEPLGLGEGYMPTDDADTQDLLRAMEQGEFPEPIDDQDFSDEIIPDTAAEMSDDIRSMVEELAGESNAQDDQEEDQKEEDTEELEQTQKSSIDDSEKELPDLEVKEDQLENSNSEKASNSQDDTDSNAELEKFVSSEAKSEDALDGDKNKDEDKEIFTSNENNTPTDYGYPQQQQQPGMMQTSALGAFGHAFGSVINGVFHGIGMALGTGVSAIRQTKEAFNTGSGGATISNKVEAGTRFNPAQKAMENSFNPQRVDEWKQARVDNEFINLETDMDAHIRSVDRLKQTEWAKKLHTIEESGDPEMLAKAPAILNMAKSKTDFKGADKDLSYFQGHIEQRAERLSGMLKESNQDPQRLEDLMNNWQEKAKKRLEDLPDSKDKQGILERIQNSVQNTMASLRSLFGAGSTQRM